MNADKHGSLVKEKEKGRVGAQFRNSRSLGFKAEKEKKGATSDRG